MLLLHVQGGDTLDLGNDHVLEFVMAPNLHWPDTMFTLDRKSGILFTCDAFGMHYCSQTVRSFGPLNWWFRKRLLFLPFFVFFV